MSSPFCYPCRAAIKRGRKPMLRINEERFLRDLKELAQIGATPDGGVSRPALTTADIEGRRWFQGKIAEAGLDYKMDGAGNQSAILHSDPPSEKRILAGSHLDSVPNGGRYDGSLGVLVAFEALRTLKDSGITLPVSLEAVNFTDEESAIMGLMGSKALVGQLTEADFERSRVDRDELMRRFSAIGITRESMLAARRDDALAWVELHIEQGTRLETAGIDIGVVNAIVGIRSIHVTFRGEAAHAGTKPMELRRDALWGASQFVLRAREHVMDNYRPGVCNVGMINAKPGAFNIVPAEVYCALEFRHGTEAAMDQMQADLLGLLEECAAEFNLSVDYESTPPVIPATMSESVMAAIERAADALGLSRERMLSFAGHDTQNVATIAPAAMFFVPSVDGISHNPKEFTGEADCVNGANLMLHTLLELMRSLN
ncbi:MAG: M20 family metallo-hydrolase [Chloroflexi bacterium]|nr:M20 family metallo-hydrolase [Chloroflexota bacterium]